MSLRIKVWGARGSLPSPHTPAELEDRLRTTCEDLLKAGVKKPSEIAKFLEARPRAQVGGFGGNTPCFEVKAGKTHIIIDGGSGIRPLGYELMKGPSGKGQGEVHIFMTHFHWDHLIGLPFFNPIFVSGNKVHVYAVQKELPDIFRGLFRKPFFPVPLERLGAKIEYHKLEPRVPFQLGELELTPYQLDHPDPCWGYKIRHGKKVYSHCVDTEARRVSPQQLGLDLPLYQGVDLMIFDAQYSLMEAREKVDWGHASANVGLDLAMREGIKKVLFLHHDPAAADSKIAAAEDQARGYYESRLKAAKRKSESLFEVDWAYAHEGLEVII